MPQRLLGRDLFWWLTTLGLLSKSVESRLSRRARGRDTLIGSSRRDLTRHGVTVRPRAVGADGPTIRFADASELEVDAEHTRGSALLGFVADDAAFIAGRIDDHHDRSAASSTAPAPQAAGATEGAS